MSCPSREALNELVVHQQRVVGPPELEGHVATCARCEGIVAALIPTARGPLRARADAEALDLAPGDRLGRYIIQRVLGSGGMGVVYAAHDWTLDRRVALKLLRIGGAHEARELLLREARAMARLAHRNVVTVHEVGEEGGKLFVAMELIDGLTLRAWLAEAPRPRAQILEIFDQAGEGLAAAHEAGLIHRDFKPENVLVGKGGEPHVTDFGIAIARKADLSADLAPPATTPQLVTTVAGTPGYLAPEQLRIGPIDARADQFSFCVSLYEALYAERPHGEPDGVSGVGLNATVAPVRPAPAGTRVPAGLRKILLRGLSPNPEDRWPSMRALLEAIAARRRRARGWAIAATISVATIAAIAVGTATARVSAQSPCTGAAAKLDPVWGEGRRAQIQQALRGSGKPQAAGTWTSVAASLDAWATAWATMHKETCEATKVRAEQSSEILDLRMECLRHRLIELQSLTGLLAAPDDEVIANAPRAALALTPVARCADVSSLKSLVPLPSDPGRRQAIEALQTLVADSETLALANKYSAGLPLAKRAALEALDAGYEPVRAAALVSLGNLAEGEGDYPTAHRALYDGALAARAGGDDEVEARAWTLLVYLAGFDEGKVEQGWLYARHANAITSHRPLPAIATQLAAYEGALFYRQGRFAEAAERAKQALELAERVEPPNPLAMGRAVSLLGSSYSAMGRTAEAVDCQRRSLQLRARGLGADHPDLAVDLHNLAWALGEEGDIDGGLVAGQRSFELYAASVGPDHQNAARSQSTLGLILRSAGRFDEALPLLEQALKKRRAALGLNHPDTALASCNLGYLLLDLNRAAEAAPLFFAAKATIESLPDASGQLLADALTGLGTARFELGNTGEALALLERAHTLRLPDDTDPMDRGITSFALARALATGPRARGLADSARADFLTAGPRCVRQLAVVDAWRARE